MYLPTPRSHHLGGRVKWGTRKWSKCVILKGGTCGRNHPPTGVTTSSRCSAFFCKGPDAWWNWGVPGLNWPMPPKTTLSTTSVEIKPQSCESSWPVVGATPWAPMGAVGRPVELHMKYDIVGLVNGNIHSQRNWMVSCGQRSPRIGLVQWNHQAANRSWMDDGSKNGWSPGSPQKNSHVMEKGKGTERDDSSLLLLWLLVSLYYLSLTSFNIF